VVKPQDNGYRRSSINATASRSDIHHMRRRGAKSFVDDLVLSRGVVLSRAELFCDLLRLSLTTRRFVRCRRTYLKEEGTRASIDRLIGRAHIGTSDRAALARSTVPIYAYISPNCAAIELSHNWDFEIFSSSQLLHA
jgi:hypothetical protein